MLFERSNQCSNGSDRYCIYKKVLLNLQRHSADDARIVNLIFNDDTFLDYANILFFNFKFNYDARPDAALHA